MILVNIKKQKAQKRLSERKNLNLEIIKTV